MLSAFMRKVPKVRAQRLIEEATIALLPWMSKSDRRNILHQWRMTAATQVRHGLPADGAGVAQLHSGQDLRDWFWRAGGLRV